MFRLYMHNPVYSSNPFTAQTRRDFVWHTTETKRGHHLSLPPSHFARSSRPFLQLYNSDNGKRISGRRQEEKVTRFHLSEYLYFRCRMRKVKIELSAGPLFRS